MAARQTSERKLQIISAVIIAGIAIVGIWFAWLRPEPRVTPRVELTDEELEQKLTAPPGSTDAISPNFIKEVIKQTSAPPQKP